MKQNPALLHVGHLLAHDVTSLSDATEADTAQIASFTLAQRHDAAGTLEAIAGELRAHGTAAAKPAAAKKATAKPAAAKKATAKKATAGK